MKQKLAEAIALLDDKHLVWSDDFETIRLPLSDLLERLRQSESTEFDDELDTLLHALLQIDYTDPVTTDPLMQWLDSAARQLEIVEYTASRSERTAAAIRRLFRSI